jgi:excisionase family DNA binding protein
MSAGGSNALISVRELAEWLSVPEKTIYNCWQGWGLPAKRVGKHLRFAVRDVDAWLQERDIPADASRGAS